MKLFTINGKKYSILKNKGEYSIYSAKRRNKKPVLVIKIEKEIVNLLTKLTGENHEKN